MKRLAPFAAAALLLATLGSAPVSAQGRSAGCSQATTGGGTATGGNQSANNPSNSTGVLTGLVDVLVQDVQALNNIQANVNNLVASNNVSVVCLNDVLNQNDVHILQDVLNGSPILSNDLNNSLNNDTILTDFLNHNNIANNVQVIGVNLTTGQIYVLSS